MLLSVLCSVWYYLLMRREKEHLVPFEKSKRVIYLEEWGQKKKSFPVTGILYLMGVLCLLYCVAIALFMGYGSLFFLIWGVAGIFFCLLGLLLSRREWLLRIPKWIRKCFVVCCALGVLLFVLVEGMIISRFSSQAAPGADYMIVLGAQWKPNGPGYMLQKRLEEAVDYLNQNPDTMVIVSGGQGHDEVISEAEGMKGYLTEAGIPEERILTEDKSASTEQNLSYSAEFLNKEEDTVVLVTNNFHMFRALMLAKKLGYAHIEGQSAASYPAMVPNNMVREFFGVVKEFLTGGW